MSIREVDLNLELVYLLPRWAVNLGDMGRVQTLDSLDERVSKVQEVSSHTILNRLSLILNRWWICALGLFLRSRPRSLRRWWLERMPLCLVMCSWPRLSVTRVVDWGLWFTYVWVRLLSLPCIEAWMTSALVSLLVNDGCRLLVGGSSSSIPDLGLRNILKQVWLGFTSVFRVVRTFLIFSACAWNASVSCLT